MSLVIDASVGTGFMLPDEIDPVSIKAFKLLHDGEETWVPAHWATEVANALLYAEPKRITEALSEELCAAALRLPLHVDGETFQRAFTSTLALAKRHTLTVYDAAYLELAMRKGATLATKDAALAKAAKSAGVPLL